jgi:hypothetical protein
MIHPSQSLWPSELQNAVESPNDILEGQARVLRDLTGGNLTADIRVIHDECEQRITLCLDLIGPNDGGRHRVLTISYSTVQMYPCIVQAQAELADPLAYSDCEVRELIRQILKTREVRALATSLIAKARQTAPKGEPIRERRHKGHRTFRPAWAGVGPEEDDAGSLLALLRDEPQGID